MNRPVWAFYAGYYRGLWGRLAGAVALAVAQSVALLPVGLLVRAIFDEALPAGEGRALLLWGGAMFGLFALEAAAQIGARTLALHVTKIAVRRLRYDLLAHSYRLGRGVYTGADVGQLHTRLVQDTERVDVFSNEVVAKLLPGAATVVGLSAVLLYLNAELFAALAAVIPALLWLSRTLGRRVRQHTQRFNLAFEGYSRNVLLMLQALDAIHLRGGEAAELARQARTLDEVRGSSERMAWLSAVYGISQGTIMAVATLLILVLGGQAVAAGRMTLGDLLAFWVTVGLMRSYVNNVIGAVPIVITGAVSLGTLQGLLHTAERAPYAGTRRLDFAGHLAFEGVAFGYGETLLFDGVDLEVRPGQTTAIVGPNGAGKSTLAYLAVGFYRPARGRVLAEGVPLDELDLAHLRRQIGVVMQDPFILPGTVAENIAFGDEALGDVEAAARAATADEFIRALPEGYQTVVGEQGVRLSGGQRQRLALARALLARPRLLILDEPTNHLDQEAIARFLANLRTLPEKPGILLISHNRGITAQADVTYRLEARRLVPDTPELAALTATAV
ncbi:MAG: ABC transporter ATP-binding protein [Anaerolineales bacterium]|nr:ABC transporter ATP-binding protein [Anaerolineales bacterium]